MNAVWTCVKCDGPQEVEMIEVTTLMDGPYNRRYIEGMHEACHRCGSTVRPIRWERVLYRPPILVRLPSPFLVAAIAGSRALTMAAPVIEVHAGPSADRPLVPTPEDLLRAAGIPTVAMLRMDLLDDEWGYWDDLD